MSPKLEAFLTRLEEFDHEIPIEELTVMLEAARFQPADVRNHLRYSDECYQRNLLRAGSAYQALALCWKPGQRSVIHDHRGSACGVSVLQGTARETTYARGPDGMLVAGETRDMHCGEVCGSVDADIHQIVNPSDDEGLVTLHIYSPPLRRCGTYSLDSPEIGEWVDPNAPASRVPMQA